MRSMGSQSRISSPEHQRWNEPPTYDLAVKSIRDYVFQEETGDFWKHTHTSKGPTHKISFAATHPGIQQRMSAPHQSCMKKTGVCGSGGRTLGMITGTPVLSHSPKMQMQSSFGWNTLVVMAIASYNTIAPTFRLPVTPSCGAYTMLISQLPKPRCKI